MAIKNKNNDKPWNVETPAYLLDDAVTPADRMFIRNNGLVPEAIDVANCMSRVDRFWPNLAESGFKSPQNRLAWQHWATDVKLSLQGSYEIWARATDDTGLSQPMVMPQWNPEGYCNNSCHHIAV